MMNEMKVIVLMTIDPYTGKERVNGIVTQKQYENYSSKRWWTHTKEMIIPKNKWEDLHLGNVRHYLSQYQVY